MVDLQEDRNALPLQNAYRLLWQDYVELPGALPLTVANIEAVTWGVKILPGEVWVLK